MEMARGQLGVDKWYSGQRLNGNIALGELQGLQDLPPETASI